MVQDLSAPVSITVVAVEVIARMDENSARMAFKRSKGALASLGAMTEDEAGMSMVLAFDPESEVGPLVNRLGEILSDIEERCPDAPVRALLHFGTAFRARDVAGRVSYRGSALRSVANSLKRSSLDRGLYATGDFANYSANLKALLGFELSNPDGDGFHLVTLGERRRVVTSELHSTDPALVDWIKARLARDLGPFASALVDNASHSTRTAKELAAAVGHEIVDPTARQRFDSDVFRYLKARE